MRITVVLSMTLVKEEKKQLKTKTVLLQTDIIQFQIIVLVQRFDILCSRFIFFSFFEDSGTKFDLIVNIFILQC